MKGWLAEMMALAGQPGHSHSAIRRHMMVLSLILDAAVDEERIKRNPAAKIRLPKPNRNQPRYLTAEQVTDLANAIQPHYRLLVLTAAYSGMRWGELAGLDVESVDVLRGRINVERQLQELSSGRLEFNSPKSAAGLRSVTIPRSLAQALGVQFSAAAVVRSGLAFPTATGRPMRSTNFRRPWKAACEAAGLDGLKFHELRHTAVALAVEQGAHPLTIKQRMGHSTIAVTMDTYGALFPSMDEALAQALDGVLQNSGAKWGPNVSSVS